MAELGTASEEALLEHLRSVQPPFFVDPETTAGVPPASEVPPDQSQESEK